MILSDGEAAFSDSPMLDANGFPIATPSGLTFLQQFGSVLGVGAAAAIGWYVFKKYKAQSST